MLKYGVRPGQIYNAEKVEAIREELNGSALERFNPGGGPFPLKGEFNHDIYHQRRNPDPDAHKHPSTYPAAVFVEHCRKAVADELPQLLTELCLDPGIDIATLTPWFFPALIPTLLEYEAAWIETRNAGKVVTQIGAQVNESLDYALDRRCLVLVDGNARIGKTFAVKAWCENHPGQARYVQVPSSNDDIGFFRAIARSLGVSINQNSKAQQLRDRIEEVLQGSKLTLVLDEGHYVWPQSNYREAMPRRVNWIMTALINYRVPVVLVTTPQFMRTQSALERKSHWTSEQFTGRIGHYERLPDTVCDKDLAAVARALLPEACEKSIEGLVLYAKTSVKYLAAIEMATDRARFLAGKAKRDKVTLADVRSAIKGSVIPSDSAFAESTAAAKRAGRSRAFPTPLQPAYKADPRGDETSAGDRHGRRQADDNLAVEETDRRARPAPGLIAA